MNNSVKISISVYFMGASVPKEKKMKKLLLLCSLVLTANFAFAQGSNKNIKAKSTGPQTERALATASDSSNAYKNNPVLANAAKLVETEKVKKKPLAGRVARYTEIACAEESRKNFINSALDPKEQIRRKVYTELLSRDYVDAFASDASLTDRAVTLPVKIKFASIEEFNETFVENRTLLYKKPGKPSKKEPSISVIREYVDEATSEAYKKIVNNFLAAIVIDDKTAFILERIVYDQKGDYPDTYRTVVIFKDSGKLAEYQDKTENQLIMENPSNVLWDKPYGDLYIEMVKKLKENGIRQY